MKPNYEIIRVDGCPCGDTTIKLYKGSESEEHHTISGKLDTFLKGSNKQKELLRKESPDFFSHFTMIWDIRNRHMIKGLPSSYIFFFLKCCYQPDCTHPVCQSGHPSSTVCWYPGGYPVSYLPLPVPDSERPWGSQTCSTCKGFCAGHYSKFVDTNDPAALKSIKPPSVVLKQKFSELVNKLVTEDDARSVLLSVKDMKIWIDHLATVVQNRKRAWLRQQSAQQQSDHVEREGSEECYCGTLMWKGLLYLTQ